jgi:hypothetical protein
MTKKISYNIFYQTVLQFKKRNFKNRTYEITIPNRPLIFTIRL